MKKILLTSTLTLFINCFLSFQAIAGDDARYPAYDFQPTIIYRSPELSASLSPKPKSTPKVTPRTKVKQQNPAPIETTSEKPKQSKAAPATPKSAHQSNNGFSFGSYLMIAIILFAVWVAYKDSMSAKSPAPTKPKSLSKTPKTSKAKPKKKQSDGVLVLSEKATQCQASTAKGSRCTRDNNLQLRLHAVDKGNCQFAVCKQHDRESFKPHPSVLKGL